MTSKILHIVFLLAVLPVFGQSSYTFELDQKVQGEYVLVEINVEKQSGEDLSLGTCNLPFIEENGVLDLENAILVDSLTGVFSSKYDQASYKNPGLFSVGFIHVMIFKNNNGNGSGALVSELKQTVTTIAIPIKDPCGESELAWLGNKAAIYDMDNKKISSDVQLTTVNSLKLSNKPAKPLLAQDGDVLKAQGENIEWYLDGVKLDIEGNELLPVVDGEYQAADFNGCERSFSDPLVISKVTANDALSSLKQGLSVFPNPFVGNTKLKYTVEKTANVTIEVFDILGNKLETLVDEIKNSGQYEIDYLGGLSTSEGIYIVKMKIGEEVYTKRIVELGDNG